MKPTKAQLAAMAELQAATAQARDIGREYFVSMPQAMLVEIARHGARLYPHRKDCEIAFLQGYIEARTNHDAFKRGE
ncbi:MAG TPA: hypothetical protein VGN99_00795 [Steroidobacteraceae bacterium]|nr:hypothetical protein [Steroidobacteraceae bacterium]